jgi:ribose 5-phosphate isomerase RpiB
MGANGQLTDRVADQGVLHWQGRVVAVEDLRRSLNGHRELLVPPGVVITPLAAEELRTRGIRLNRQGVQTTAQLAPQQTRLWGYGTERPDSLVQSAIEAVQREGLPLKALAPTTGEATCRWARSVAECIARRECRGGVLFCQDPGLVCCVANKLTGLRATAVTTVSQAARATLTLGANLVAVEMPGRTFFEVRQILRTLCRISEIACPAGVACVLQELDGHAHR